MIDKITRNPKILFLIDGLGALLTSFLLVVVLTKFQDDFRMPMRILYYLSLIALVISIYSFSCHFLLIDRWEPFLKGIIFANLTYCCLTMGSVYYFYQDLSLAGVLYFGVELIIIIALVSMEFATLSNLSKDMLQ